MLKKTNQKQQGSVLLESVFVIPLFGIVFMLVVEMIALHKAALTLDLATAEAVRAGSLNNAHHDAMENALAEGMAPVYAGKSECEQGLPGIGCALELQKSLKASGGKTITIVNPGKEAWESLSEVRFLKVSGQDYPTAQYVIPNENSSFRQAAFRELTHGQKQQQLMILRNANRLEINTRWCHKLLTPGLDRLAWHTILKSSRSDGQQECNRVTEDANKAEDDHGVYVALVSTAMEPMHTPVHFTGDNLLSRKQRIRETAERR